MLANIERAKQISILFCYLQERGISLKIYEEWIVKSGFSSTDKHNKMFQTVFCAAIIIIFT
jgi:hypothetical protein